MLPVSMHPNIGKLNSHMKVGGRVLLKRMVEAAEHFPDYEKRLRDWLDFKVSTIELRKLSEPFGNYWVGVDFANIVDQLDTASCHVQWPST